jgi:TatD DNase family protein
MRLIDTHCHIDLYPDYAELIEETERAGIYTIAVTNTPSVFRRCLALTQGRRYVRTALGLHPQLAVERRRELGLMRELLPETKYVGEIGLDFVSRDVRERTIQQEVFTSILEQCASSREKVLTVHSRRAAEEVVSLIGDSYPCKVILHWFSGTHRVMEKAIASGFYFSVNPAMMMSDKGRRIVSEIPRERLLTESDGPFVTIEDRRARPRDVAGVVRGLADLYGVEPGQAAETIYTNFRRILT